MEAEYTHEERERKKTFIHNKSHVINVIKEKQSPRWPAFE